MVASLIVAIFLYSCDFKWLHFFMVATLIVAIFYIVAILNGYVFF
jgi:hypothetical protein